MAPLVPFPFACTSDGHLGRITTYGGCPVHGATGARPLRVSFQQSHRTGGPTDGAAGARPPRALFAHDRTCHCWPCRSHFGFESHVWQDLGESVYRTRKVHNTMRGKLSYSPPSHVFARASARLSLLPRLPRAPRPSLALSVLCGISSAPEPFVPERARCIAICGALWHPALCCAPSGCTRARPVFRPCPSTCSLCLCAHGAEQCVRHHFSLFYTVPWGPFAAPLPFRPLVCPTLAPSVLPPSGHYA